MTANGSLSCRRNALAGFLIAFALLAVGPKAKGQSPHFQSYSFSKGSEKRVFNSLFQDSTGYLWLASSMGAIRFDGSKTLHLLDTTEERDVTAIAQGPDGTIWLGMASGNAYYWQHDSLRAFVLDEGLAYEPISDMLFDREGNWWIGTAGDGLYYYTQDRLYRLDEENGMPDLFIHDLMLDEQGRVWACTDAGIAICTLKGRDASLELLQKANGLPDEIVRKALPGPEGKVWIATEDQGFFLWDVEKRKAEMMFEEEEWAYGAVVDMQWHNGQLWAATAQEGVLAYDPKHDTWERYHAGNGLSEKRLAGILADLEGNMWYLGRKGLVRSYSNQITFFDGALAEEEGPQAMVDVATQGASVWWVNAKGLFEWQPDAAGGKARQRLPVAEGVAFTSLHADGQGSLWIGTYGQGVWRYQPGSGKIERFVAELPSPNVMDITGSDSTLWLATLKGAVRIGLAGGKPAFEVLGQEQGLEASYLYQVFPDRQGRVWFATDGKGALVLEKGQFRSMETLGMAVKTIYGFAEDGEGGIWMNAMDEGLYRYDAGKLVHWEEEYGLDDRGIQAMASDEQGNIVIMHDLGLEVIDVRRGVQHLFNRRFGVVDKMPSLNAATATPGHLLFGTRQGLVRFRSSLRNGKIPAVPVIEGLKVLGRSQPLGKGQALEFGHNENHLSIQYLGLSFLDPEGVRFQYRLDGYDRDWIPSKNNSVTYSSLPPGQYTFRLRASHDHDFSEANEAVLTFQIDPPLWSRWWFQLLVLAVGAAAAYGFVQRRERLLRSEKIRLEQKVLERTTEIQEQNEELKVQRDQIQEQHEALADTAGQLQQALKGLEATNQKITNSINYAKRIQTSILPIQGNMARAFPKGHFTFYIPRDIVSGDFYWMYELKHRVYFAVVDCTGHGVPGAFMSLIGYSLLNEIVSRNPNIGPAQALEVLDQGVVSALRQDEAREQASSTADGMDVAMVCWDKRANTLSLGLAKRPAFVMDNEGEMMEIKGDKRSIGGKSARQREPFTDHLFPLKEGMRVYLCSDGFTDQFGGPEGRKMGAQRLRELLEQYHHLPMPEQFEAYRRFFLNWKGDQRQIDDVLLAGLSF